MARRAEEHAKSRHHYKIKSMAKLPYNPRIWKTLLKAHFQQFMTVFGTPLCNTPNESNYLNGDFFIPIKFRWGVLKFFVGE